MRRWASLVNRYQRLISLPFGDPASFFSTLLKLKFLTESLRVLVIWLIFFIFPPKGIFPHPKGFDFSPEGGKDFLVSRETNFYLPEGVVLTEAVERRLPDGTPPWWQRVRDFRQKEFRPSETEEPAILRRLEFMTIV